MKTFQNKILISGGNGRLGESLTKYLLSTGNKIVSGDKLLTKKIEISKNKNFFFLSQTLQKKKI